MNNVLYIYNIYIYIYVRMYFFIIFDYCSRQLKQVINPWMLEDHYSTERSWGSTRIFEIASPIAKSYFPLNLWKSSTKTFSLGERTPFYQYMFYVKIYLKLKMALSRPLIENEIEINCSWSETICRELSNLTHVLIKEVSS